jgi:hypothetical protein
VLIHHAGATQAPATQVRSKQQSASLPQTPLFQKQQTSLPVLPATQTAPEGLSQHWPMDVHASRSCEQPQVPSGFTIPAEQHDDSPEPTGCPSGMH